MPMSSDVKGFGSGEWSVVLNCGPAIILPDGTMLGNFQSGLYRNIEIEGDELVVVTVGDSRGVTDDIARYIRSVWEPVSELYNLEQLRGADFFRSPVTDMGRLKLSFWYSGDNLAGPIHRHHAFYELHTQILGVGEMQKFHENDESTIYESELMVPGHTHRPFFNAERSYPWHRYKSIKRSVLLAVESPNPIPVR